MKIGVIGNFSLNKESINGQTIKTRTVYEVLEKKMEMDEFFIVDTAGSKKRFVTIFKEIYTIFKQTDKVIIIPAQAAVLFLFPFIHYANKRFNKNIYYVVIGNWIADITRKNNFLIPILKSFESIYAETYLLQNALQSLGIQNVKKMNNFKEIKKLEEQNLVIDHKLPYKLCTFSRVTEKKGISDAITIVNKVNETFETDVVHLDIYGPIESKFENQFYEMINNSPTISYKGTVSPEQSVDVIKNYYLLLFPTRWVTEGIPGTIIDAYSSGVPVLAARWNAASEIIKERVTGVTYEQNNLEDFYENLLYLIENKTLVEDMKVQCLREVDVYSPDESIKVLEYDLRKE